MSLGWPVDDTTNISITAELGVARTASISYKAPAENVDLDSLIGNRVIVTFTGWANGIASGYTLFTGKTIAASYDLRTDEITLSCADELQAVVNKMSQAQLEQLVPGQWHTAIFGDEKPEGWDYLQQLLLSAPGSVELNARGAIRYTPYGSTGAALTLAADSMECSDDNVSASRGLSNPLNNVEITLHNRYELFRKTVRRYQFDFGDICENFDHNKRMPIYSMLVTAIERHGLLCRAASAKFLPDAGSVCAIPIWVGDPFFKLMSEFGVILEDRWAQQVTEEIKITVSHQGSISAFGENLDEMSVAVDTDADDDAWVNDAGDVVDPDAIGPAIGSPNNPPVAASVYPGLANDDVGGAGYGFYLGESSETQASYSEADSALSVAVAIARNKIKTAHRVGRVSAKTKLNPVMDVGLTASIQAGKISASGQVGRVVFTIDPVNCEATMSTTLFKVIGGGGTDGSLRGIEAPADEDYPQVGGSYDIAMDYLENGGEAPAEDFNGIWFSGPADEDESDMKLVFSDAEIPEECTSSHELRREDQDQVISVGLV